MTRFSRAMSHLKSTQIDEKIKVLNKELEKTGVLAEQPANSTANFYYSVEPIPAQEEETTAVPDPDGWTNGGTQDDNGGDTSNPTTWDTGWNNVDDMQNENDVGGEVDRPIPLTPDLSGWNGSSVSANDSVIFGGSRPEGQTQPTSATGIVQYRGDQGQSCIGSVGTGNKFVQILVGDAVFGGYAYPGTRTGYYGSYSEKEFEAAQNIASAYEANKNGGSVTRKAWVPFDTANDGVSYAAYTGAKKTTTKYTSGSPDGAPVQWALKDVYVLAASNTYVSQPAVAAYDVITRDSLDDPKYYPGNPNRFMDFLRGVLDVGEKAFEWLTDKAEEVAGEVGDKLSDLPSVEETENKIDDAILDGLTLLNDILDPVAGAAEKFNDIVGPLAGGGGKGGLVMKSLQMAAGQIAGKTTTTFALPADNAIAYNLQHAAALVTSIISGRDQEVKGSRKVKGQMLDALDPDKVENILRIGPHTEISSEKTIRPTEDKKGDIFNDGSPFGIIGGYEFSVDPETNTYKIIAQKMLRTDKGNLVQTSGSDEWQDPKDAKGKITRFQDIPEIEDANLTSLVDKLINEPGIIRDFIKGGAKLGDKITGQEGTPSSVYDAIKNDPTALDEVQKIVTTQINNLKPGSKASNFVQGTASNSVYIRKVLTKLGFPKSQAEKEGKGYGQVYTVISGNVSELSPKLQDIINNKKNVKESYLSEGWESPKHTYIDKDQQKRWFNADDVAPVYPKDPPPEMIRGYHPKLLSKSQHSIPYIKVTKKDLIRSHKLTKDEAQEMIQLVDRLNEFIKNNPDKLAYARERYPKDDVRLAELNFKLDMQLAAADDYIETQFPENKRRLKLIQRAVRKSTELTDPKTYKKNSKYLPFEDTGILRTVNDLETYGAPTRKKKTRKKNKWIQKPKKKTKQDIMNEKMIQLEMDMKKFT